LLPAEGGRAGEIEKGGKPVGYRLTSTRSIWGKSAGDSELRKFSRSIVTRLDEETDRRPANESSGSVLEPALVGNVA